MVYSRLASPLRSSARVEEHSESNAMEGHLSRQSLMDPSKKMAPPRRQSRTSTYPKGILKPSRVRKERHWKTLGIWQRLRHLAQTTKHAAARYSGFQRFRWHWNRLVQDSHVEFSRTVTVVEFSRLLDGGDTVPGDGTIVCLGLGKPVSVGKLPLAAQPPLGRAPIEERAWLPSMHRVQVLRKAMGDNCFFGAWQKHKSVTRIIMREREETNKTNIDFSYMPKSLAEAQQQAAKNAADVRRRGGASHAIAVSPRPVKSLLKRKRADSENTYPKHLASPLRSALRAASETPDRKPLASPLRSLSHQCQRCAQSLNAHNDGMPCLCLAPSPRSPLKTLR